MRQFTVYSGDDCQFCDMAKKLITSSGHEYRELNVSRDLEARQFFVEKGYRGVPVIYLDGEEFCVGYPQLLNKIGSV